MANKLTIKPVNNAGQVASLQPAFFSRLRPGRFTSPAGVQSSFLYDSLSRSRGKKTAAHEVSDSDTTIIQDSGSTLLSFPMDVYFVGENGDQEADIFFKSLTEERYTPDAPGILNHPRWGDVTVIPFDVVDQSESYVSGAGVFRVSVTLRETESTTRPSSAGLSPESIGVAAKKINFKALERLNQMATDVRAKYAKANAVVKSKIKIVNDVVSTVTNVSDEIRQEINELQDTVTAMGNDGSPIIDTVDNINRMIESVSSIPQAATDFFASVVQMSDDILQSFVKDDDNATDKTDSGNIALLTQAMGTSAISAVAVAAVSIDFETRDSVGSVIDQIDTAYLEYVAHLEAMGGESNFAIDHDALSGLSGIVYDTIQYLTDTAFSLKMKRTIVLSAPSDVISLCWQYYRDLSASTIDFFCRTNKLTDYEYIELPSGREVVIYG